MISAGWIKVSAAVLLALATASDPSSAQSELQGYLDRYQQLFDAGNYSAALAEASKFEAAARANYGTTHESYASALFLQAGALCTLGNYFEARQLYTIALAIFESAPPSAASTRDLAKTLNGLGRVYDRMGLYVQAELIQKRALSLIENSAGNDQTVLSYALEDLGNAYLGEGRYADAEEYYKRTLVIRENALGGDHTAVAQSLNLLSNVYMRAARFPEAETALRRAIDIEESVFGPDHPNVAISINNLAEVYRLTGRYALAEPLQKRALNIQEKALGPDHPHVGVTLNNLAEVYRLTGRYALAEPLQKRALNIQEKALGPDHPHVGVTLNNLALTYFKWGHYLDAEPIYLRAIGLQEKSLGAEHPQVATTLNNLGLVYIRLGRLAEAEPVLKRARAIREKVLPKDHPDISESLVNLAAEYRNSGRSAEGLPLLQRAVNILAKNFGIDHLNTAYGLTATADAYVDLKRYAEAEPFAQRSLPILMKELGPAHMDTASALKTLAQINLGLNRVQRAGDYSREAVQVVIRALRNDDVTSAGFDRASLREYFDVHLAVLYRGVSDGLAGQDAVAEAFATVQWANESAAAAGLKELGARSGAPTTALAGLVRKQQDEAAEIRSLDKSILTEIAKRRHQRDPKGEALLRHRRAELQADLVRSNAQISTEFPEYAALVNPEPLTPAQAQKLLAPGEALVLFHVSDMGNYVWAVTGDRMEWRKIDLSRERLVEAVRKLRASMNIEEIVKKKTAPLDLDLAYSLYSTLLGPVEPLLLDKNHLAFVPTGELTALPLHVLLTDEPRMKPTQRDHSAYRRAPWLLRRHAITELPSVSSLKVRRTRPAAPQAYLGFGDPLLSKTSTGEARPANLSHRGHINLEVLSVLAPLPETADELRSVAKFLGAPATVVKLGKNATERAVKTAKLDDYRILHFATHALVAGEINGLAEPALVFSTPRMPSELDDGLLTSSEVATLKVNAELVILSACNTADGDKPGAKDFSGLARAFFHAGAKMLMVALWCIDNTAAQLTARTVQGLAHTGLSPAEALRRAMLEVVDSSQEIDDSYPGFWGPFVMFGLMPPKATTWSRIPTAEQSSVRPLVSPRAHN
jgi:CHAT domain-containing protein/Tfp pilus assembly protein PilF